MVYDVAIVGASLAGCTAATLFARYGLSVALLEREADASAYKKICTHYIQASAKPTLDRLGLSAQIEAAGGVPNHIELWTRWGWITNAAIRRGGFSSHGYNIRRQTLDPMIRQLAAGTSGVNFMPAHTASGLLKEDGRVVGVRAQSPKTEASEIRARLIVGADGRDSRVAESAGLTAKQKPHGRFAYYAYCRELRLVEPGLTQVWLLEPNVAYSFPNEDGYTLLALFPAQGELDHWKRDIEARFIQCFEALPRAPAIREAKRVSPFVGMIKLPNQARSTVQPGLALIGDAALASDPLWGVGCGWALQSAEWLVDATAEVLREGHDLKTALARYRRQHRLRLGGHAFLIADFASGRALNPLERLMFSAAARDPVSAAHIAAFASRSIGLSRFLAPRALVRAARVNIAHLAHRPAAAVMPENTM